MGKSVRAHTVRLHKQIKKQKLQKNELRRAELIASRAAESLAKYNASLEGTLQFHMKNRRVMDSTLPVTVEGLWRDFWTDQLLARDFC